MSRLRLVNLLDDFALGGVSRGLGIFDADAVRAVADCGVEAVARDAVLAPRLAADVIVVHFPPNWRRLAFLASLRLRNPRARIILVEHSYTAAWEALKVPRPQRFRLMLRLALALPHHVVAVSHRQAQWLRAVAGLRPARLDVIHPFSTNVGLADLPLPHLDRPRPLRIGAYGRFCEQKGFDQLIQAFRAGAMPGAELVIGGFGSDEDALRQLAGDDPHIHFAGKVDNVAAFLASCDVVSVPSRWEAYGQVANEAREAGRPILVAPVDGLPEQVGAAGMVVDFSQPKAVAQAWASLDAGRRDAMAVAGRRATIGCGQDRAERWVRLISRVAQWA